MKRLLFFSLVILPISLFAEGGLPDKHYIYVVGDAGVEKPADMVTLRFELVARAPDQAKANEEVQGKSANIFALLKDKKIAANDVIAEDIKSEADFEQAEGYLKRGKLIGYVVTRPFAVKFRDVPTFPRPEY